MHGGIFDIAYHSPNPWSGPKEQQPNSMLPGTDGDILTEDFCRMGTTCMIRAVLPMHVIGAPNGEMFSFGVWGTLAPENFAAMVEAFDTGQGDLGPYFSWLMNVLPGCEPVDTKCVLYPQPDRQRPVLLIQDDGNPWKAPQDDGIAFDALLDLYARTGHDLRPHLMDA